jgi:hypothetical protein
MGGAMDRMLTESVRLELLMYGLPPQVADKALEFYKTTPWTLAACRAKALAEYALVPRSRPT